MIKFVKLFGKTLLVVGLFSIAIVAALSNVSGTNIGWTVAEPEPVILSDESPVLRVLSESAKKAPVFTGTLVPVPKAEPIVWPVVVGTLKGHKLAVTVVPVIREDDEEAAGDLADAEMAIEDKNSSKHRLARRF
jgi:hypothetical protein